MSHFIDTCAAVVGDADVHVTAMGSARGESLLDDDLVVNLRYDDGSLATISYASGGHHSTEKERTEVLGRGRSATVVDFRQVVLDGRQAWSGAKKWAMGPRRRPSGGRSPTVLPMRRSRR